MGLRRASQKDLSRARVRRISSVDNGGDVVTLAALGLMFGGLALPNLRDSQEHGSDPVGDDLFERQARLAGIPGVGIEAHAQAVGTRARSEVHVGRLA